MMIVAGMLFDAVSALGRALGSTAEDAFAEGAITLALLLFIGLLAAMWACVRRPERNKDTP